MILVAKTSLDDASDPAATADAPHRLRAQAAGSGEAYLQNTRGDDRIPLGVDESKIPQHFVAVVDGQELV
jgi:hypothetical protein